MDHRPPQLLSINVGRPQTMQGLEAWTSGIYKSPVPGPVRLGAENLDGDGQADLKVHGGPDKAVCVYSADHYPRWREELGEPDRGLGSFGENFSVTGQVESTVAIGDVYRIGTAVVQVSQPRAPCWKLGRRWNRIDMPQLVIDSGRTGWYLRVLEAGIVSSGDSFELFDKPYPQWTIEAVNDVAYNRDPIDTAAARELSECPLLAGAWRSKFRKLASA